MADRTLTFADHRRSMDGLRYVYPVLSRRAKGISLGVNLNPDKACNFDCIYCQVDRTIPGSKGVDLARLEHELDRLFAWVASGELFSHPPYDTVAGARRRVNDVCFAGDGEPTAVPEFPEAVRIAVDLKRRYGLEDVKVVLISNATLFHRARVQRGLEAMVGAQGEIWAKLDAGTEAYYQKVCVSRVPFQRILANLQRVACQAPLVIQTLFLELGAEGGPSDAELEAYVGRLQAMLEGGGQLKLVQIYSIARRPPRADVFALPDEAIDRMVAWVGARIPVPVEGYYGSAQFLRGSS